MESLVSILIDEHKGVPRKILNNIANVLLLSNCEQMERTSLSSRDGRVVRLLNTWSKSCGSELKSRLIAQSMRTLLATSLLEVDRISGQRDNLAPDLHFIRYPVPAGSMKNPGN